MLLDARRGSSSRGNPPRRAPRKLFATRPRAEWLTALGARNVPVGAVNDMAGVFEQAQAQALVLRHEVPGTPGAPGGVRATAGVRQSASTSSANCGEGVLLPPPLFGEHSAQILANELGMRAEEVAALEEAGVIFTHAQHHQATAINKRD